MESDWYYNKKKYLQYVYFGIKRHRKHCKISKKNIFLHNDSNILSSIFASNFASFTCTISLYFLC